MKSQPGVRTDLVTSRSPNQMLVTDFFGGVAQAEVLDDYTYEDVPEIPIPFSEIDSPIHSGSLHHQQISHGALETLEAPDPAELQTT